MARLTACSDLQCSLDQMLPVYKPCLQVSLQVRLAACMQDVQLATKAYTRQVGMVTFYKAALTELEMIKMKGVWGSHASRQSTADYQHISLPGLLEYEAIKAGFSRLRLS